LAVLFVKLLVFLLALFCSAVAIPLYSQRHKYQSP